MSLKRLAKQVQDRQLLRVACPKACNMQQTATHHATAGATTTQHDGANRSNCASFRRNSGRNNHATATENACNKPVSSRGEFVARIEQSRHARQVLHFTIDNTPKPITAIDTLATSQGEALERLRYAWGGRLDCVWSADGRQIWERGCI